MLRKGDKVGNHSKSQGSQRKIDKKKEVLTLPGQKAPRTRSHRDHKGKEIKLVITQKLNER